MELKVNPEYEAMMPPLSESEYQALRESISENGLYHPVIVNEDGIVLDGHHRLKACKELGIEPEYKIRKFGDQDRFIVESNLTRRHLNGFQKIEMLQPLLDKEKRKAEERQIEGGNQLPLSKYLLRGQVRDIAGTKIGVSGVTFDKGTKLIQEASEELKQKLRDGEISISRASDSIKTPKEKGGEHLERKRKILKQGDVYGEYKCGGCGDAYWVDCPGKDRLHHFVRQKAV